MRKKGIAIMALLALISGVLGGCKPKEAKLPEDYSGLSSVEFYKSGNALGGYESMKLEKNVGGDLLTITTCEDSNSKEEVTQTVVSESAISDFEKMLQKYHPQDWKDYKEPGVVALDGATTTYTVRFANPSASYSISTAVGIPESESDFCSKAYCFLKYYELQPETSAEIRHKSFDGGGTRISIEIADPEYVVWFYEELRNKDPDKELDTGSPYRQVYTFAGRIPGSTTMTVTEEGPLLEGKVVTNYLIEVGEDLKVTLTKQ
ncbi:MAG: hypothetical protein HUJ78_05620 [Mogibacterium sp.]|nr:hypothetical protein [Mogibacterium sp.]